MAMIENEMEKKVYKVEDVQNLLGLKYYLKHR